jgi:hypothetical protein
MKLYTPDKIELLEVKAVEPVHEGLLIEGQIMGTMPMRAVLTPAELRRSFRLLRPGILFALVAMLFRR